MHLTPEEIAELRENPWINSVKGQHISYSEDFKKKAYRELMDGKSMHTIFFEHGINLDVVGDGRIYVLTCRLRKRADSEEGFRDLRANNQRKPAKHSKEQVLAIRVSDLEHELAYTRQEMEWRHTHRSEHRRLETRGREMNYSSYPPAEAESPRQLDKTVTGILPEAIICTEMEKLWRKNGALIPEEVEKAYKEMEAKIDEVL